MATIKDLPNELLDQIFAYVHPTMITPDLGNNHRIIKKSDITPIHAVCRRWNRPYMTQKLVIERHCDFPDFQSTFSRLVSLTLQSQWEPKDKPAFFKGHKNLLNLVLNSPSSLTCLFNCVRLTQCEIYVNLQTLVNEDHVALDALMSLCPTLVELDLTVNGDTNGTYTPERCNEIMARFLKKRRRNHKGFTQLKRLTLNAGFYFKTIAFCKLFKSPSLEHFIGSFLDSFQTNKEVVDFFALFPKLVRLCVEPPNMFDWGSRAVHVGVKDLYLSDRGAVEEGAIELSLITGQFPNLEELTFNSREFYLGFDDSEPSSILFLEMESCPERFQPFMFPDLQTMALPTFKEPFNLVFRELGTYCPQLAKISIGNPEWCDSNCELDYGSDRDVNPIIVPQFDDITFPCLTDFGLRCPLLFNSSLAQFLARHDTLESINCDNTHCCYSSCCDPHCEQPELECVPSDNVLWPDLTSLTIKNIIGRTNNRLIEWFVSNAPNTETTF